MEPSQHTGGEAPTPGSGRIRVLMYSLLIALVLLLVIVVALERQAARRSAEGGAVPAFPSAEAPGVIHVRPSQP